MVIQVKAGGRWALSKIVSNGRGGWSTAAMMQRPRLASTVRNYFPPQTEQAFPWALPWTLVHVEGITGVPGADTILLPDRTLSQRLNVSHRNALSAGASGRLVAFAYRDFKAQIINVSAYDPSGYTGSTTMRQVLLDLYAYLQHSDSRARTEGPPAPHNTEYTDDFSTDPSSRWTQIAGTFTWDSGNGELDVATKGGSSIHIFRYSDNAPGSLDHEAQATAAIVTQYEGAAGVRMDTFDGSDAYFLEMGQVGGDDNLYVSRMSAGTYVNLTSTATPGIDDNDFITFRLAAEGNAGANVLLSWWLTDHGTTKPSDPGWIGADDSPDATYTDTAATRLDASANESGGLSGGGTATEDQQIDFFKVRAVSDRGPAVDIQWLAAQPTFPDQVPGPEPRRQDALVEPLDDLAAPPFDPTVWLSAQPSFPDLLPPPGLLTHGQEVAPVWFDRIADLPGELAEAAKAISPDVIFEIDPSISQMAGEFGPVWFSEIAEFPAELAHAAQSVTEQLVRPLAPPDPGYVTEALLDLAPPFDPLVWFGSLPAFPDVVPGPEAPTSAEPTEPPQDLIVPPVDPTVWLSSLPVHQDQVPGPEPILATMAGEFAPVWFAGITDFPSELAFAAASVVPDIVFVAVPAPPTQFVEPLDAVAPPTFDPVDWFSALPVYPAIVYGASRPILQGGMGGESGMAAPHIFPAFYLSKGAWTPLPGFDLTMLPCDVFRVRLTGPAADAVRASVAIGFEHRDP